MSTKKRYQIKLKALEKRRKRRARLKAAGKNPDQYFCAGIYVGEKK